MHPTHTPTGTDDGTEVVWFTTTRHTARIPTAALVAAGRDNDDDEYVTADGRLNPAALTGSVTGDFDQLLGDHESAAAARVIYRAWD